MCMMVYIASNSPLPLIDWDENRHAFYVEELSDQFQDQLRNKFSKSYLYYVGAHEGCGCGFSYGKYPLEDDEEPEEEAKESVTRLSQYLAEAVAKHGTIELFACWADDESAPPEHRRSITPEDIGGESFWFEEKEFLIIGNKSKSSILLKFKYFLMKLIKRQTAEMDK